jgi:hypothetical protein
MIGKYPYIDLAQIKSYFVITSSNEDARLSNLLIYSCAAVENYIGYEILSNNYTETYDGGKSSVFVSKIPLQNVHSVTEFDGTSHARLNNPQADGSSVTLLDNNYDLTVYGDTHLRSRFKKFGVTSGFFNGSNNYLSYEDSDSWHFGDEDFTLDMQVRTNSYVNSQTLISHVTNSDNYITMEYSNVNGMTFRAIEGGTETVNVTHSATTGYTANTFHHVEVVRSGSSFVIYRDGTSIATQTSANVLPEIAADLEIGRQNISGSYNYFNGFVDELRLSKVARHTAAFTAPSYQYSTDDDTILLMHFDGVNEAATFGDSHATPEDFLFYPATGEITKNLGSTMGTMDLNISGATNFRNYPRGVKITYKAGYDSADVPNDIIMATLDYAKILHKDRQDGAAFALQGEYVQERALSANFPAHIRRILDLYRII